MTSARAIRAGRAEVEIGTSDKLTAGLAKAQRQIRSLATNSLRLSAQLGAATAAITAPLALSVRQASIAEESINRFRQVFGDLSTDAGRFADDLARQINRSGVAIRDQLGVFQGFFIGLGFGEQQAFALSRQLTTLSADFASFNNLTDAEGQQRLLSALSGSAEVLDRFGINLRVAALDQQLLNSGLAESTRVATEQQKALARTQIIFDSLGRQGAVGDAARTAGSFANETKGLNAALRDLQINVGNAILPLTTTLVDRLGKITRFTADFVDQNRGLSVGVGATAAVLAGLTVGLAAVGVTAQLATIAVGGLGLVTGAVSSLPVLLGGASLAAAGLGLALLRNSELGAKGIAFLRGSLEGLRVGVARTLEGVFGALGSGNLRLAGEVAGLGFQAGVLSSLRRLSDSIVAPLEVAAQAIVRVFFGALAGLSEGFILLEKAWVQSTAGLQTAWSRFTSRLRSDFGNATDDVAKVLLGIMGTFDAALDVGAARAEIDRAASDRTNLIRGETAAALANIERDRIRELAKLDALSDASLVEIGERVSRSDAVISSVLTTATGALEGALAGTQARLDAAIAAVGEAAAEAESDPTLQRIRELVTGIGAGAAAASGPSSRGTFSAREAAIFGGSERIDREMLDRQEQILRVVDRIAQQLLRNPFVLGP